MIRAMVTVQQKDYVDRGVQTDFPRRLSRPDSSTSNPINSRIYDLPAPSTPPNILGSDISSYSPRFDIAFSRSPASGGHPIPLHTAGPTRSPPISRKHAQLPYSRPSQLNGTIQRVLSLPETSPRVVHVPRETRGVSLSERPRVSLSSSDNTTESTSAETSFLSENRSGSSRARRSFPSSDMPHTPSPPSSPESVMIIGNDMQVPISFLRRKAKSNRVYEDDSGWISWASSPPKPIPALHGPSSLPYARCPSGAEGTIVEGEDLSRMIWGLGVEDAGSQTTPSRANSNQLSNKSTPQPSFTPRLQAQRNSPRHTASHQHHNTSPRHQILPSHERLHPPLVGGITTVHETRNQILLHQHALESIGPRHSSRGQSQEHALTVPQNSDSWMDVYRAHDDLLDRLSAYDGQRGLGLDWQETLRHQHAVANEGVKPKSSHHLKPSAPVFVPASQQAAQQYPRIFIEPRILHTINPPQRLTAMEIAQQYRAQYRPQISLPTPPGSSSPQWTPFMPHYTDPFPPLDLHNLLPVKQQPSFAQPSLLRESQQCPPDPSQELRQFVFDRMQNPDLKLGQDYTNMNFSDSGIMHQNQPITPRIRSSPSQYRNPATDASPPHPGPPPNSPLPPIPSSHANRVRNFLAAPPSPTSPDPRIQSRNSVRQPRSVPFARLLQRRLSSVPEEESGHYMEPYSPPPSPPKVASAIRAPRPPSYSLADSFQPRSHSGSGQWHAGTANPVRGGFASQSRTTREFESDEARWRMPATGRGKATVKTPLKVANSEPLDSRGEDSAKTDGSTSEPAWEKEKENGKPRKKVRSKKNRTSGNSDRAPEVSTDNVSPWLAASLGAEAWL
ncbi:hypothetical protein C8F04DRAFT_988991 [Mycena alexandri]|uniref:Uncharacterized protein n=1 Tax=Mycena alexandri TaxID=1745969 RepID=A0AAD6TKY1_9AGAR|nr:hypothetical protein C8F04DRAFT_988991 [Mycena alexandri]